MADAIVSVVLEQLVSGIGQRIQEEVKLVAGVGNEVWKLTSNFQIIQAVLADAERRQVTETGVRVWLEKLKDVSYDMDEVLDTWNTASMKRLQLEASNDSYTLKSKVSSCFLFPYSGLRQVNLSRDIASKIKAITMSLDDIAKWKDIFNFKPTKTSEQHQGVETTSFIDVSDVYGRDEVGNSLVRKLLGESSERQSDLHVISIVGMGGMGKTTLAKLAYNNKEVMNNFEKRIWVCVSNPFDELMIAKAINEALGGDNSRLVKLESVIQEIHKFIVGKKFLLVLDDVWTEDFKKWEPFHDCLKKADLHGSKILVTTRKQTTALMMKSIDIVTIDELSNEQCWLIFKRIAFSGTLKEGQELEKIGKNIANKCKGIPLVAKTLGSLLRFKSTKKEWENVLYSEMWKVQEFEEGVFAPLLLSYYDLPSMVKRYFTYCAMFPKDFNFVKDELIRLWMAQGYLGLDHNKEIEIVGEEYFNTLAMRSFFQEFEKDDNGSIIKCKMHDIVHDVAQFLSKNECCMIEAKDLKERNIHASYEKTHQAMLMVNEEDTLPISICNFKKLRSLVINSDSYLGSEVTRKVIPKLFEELTSLKVLQISFYTRIPKEVEKLLHLRYLDLSSNWKLRKLPESLCELYNLQTLKLDWCYNLKVLPLRIGKLINLRYLMNYRTPSLSYMPKGIERLTKLRTLTEFHLSGGEYSGKACSLECVNNFQHMESLCIEDLIHSRDVMDEVGLLKSNKNIRQLGLRFIAKDTKNNVEAVIEAFEPPPNLQRLTINEYMGESMSGLRMTSLTNLRSISLLACIQCLHLPPLGKLPSLETLYILGMKSVIEVGDEFVGVERDDTSSSSVNEFVGVERDDTSSSPSVISFPKLKTLHFVEMRGWEVWDFGIEDDTTIMIMPSLHILKLDFCPKLKGLPKQLLEKAPLKNLSIEDCPILQQVYEKGKGDKWDHISHIPNIQFTRRYTKGLVATSIKSRWISERARRGRIIGDARRFHN